MNTQTFTNFTVIIPTLNEAQNIASLLQILNSLFPQIHIIISDDGSKDSTQNIVKTIAKTKNTVHLIDRSTEKVHGLTVSVLDAIKQTTTPFFIVMDADLQHAPENLKYFTAALSQGNTDFVIGTRKKVAGPWPLHRKLISKAGNLLGQVYLALRGIKCQDVLSGFFGAKTKLAKNLIESNYNRFEPKGYKVLFDLLKVAPAKIKIVKVPYVFNERKKGSSKMNISHLFYYFRSFLK